MRHALVLLVLAAVLTACSTRMGRDGKSETTVDAKYLAKTEIDRIADASRDEVINGLMLIADKLYKRNPKEWKKSGQASREAAVARLKRRLQNNWPEFNGARAGKAAALAARLAEHYDRVAALS